MPDYTGAYGWELYRQFHERDTPEAISTRLLKIEFYPRNLTAVRETGITVNGRR